MQSIRLDLLLPVGPIKKMMRSLRFILSRREIFTEKLCWMITRKLNEMKS